MPAQPAPGTLPTVVALFALGAFGAGLVHGDERTLDTGLVRIERAWLSMVTTLFDIEAAPGDPETHPRINMLIRNVSPRTLWAEIRLTAPAPHRGRTGTAYLEPGKTVEFEANQDAVLADTDYRVEIVVFGDSALADTLQQSSGNLRFDARTVRDIEKRVERENREDKRAEETRAREAARLAEAARLPKTYDRLMFFDDALSVFSGNAFTPRGTLVVNADSAIFRSKRRVLAIAGAQILGASVRMEGGHSCVVVEYDEGGTKRAFRLMAGLMGGFTKLDEMAASLNACRTQPKSGD